MSLEFLLIYAGLRVCVIGEIKSTGQTRVCVCVFTVTLRGTGLLTMQTHCSDLYEKALGRERVLGFVVCFILVLFQDMLDMTDNRNKYCKYQYLFAYFHTWLSTTQTLVTDDTT